MGTFLGDVVVWDVPQRQIVEVIKESNSGITSIAVAPGASVFATSSHDHRVSWWDIATRKVVARCRGHTGSIWASALSPDGRLPATGSFDGTTKLWDGTARESSAVIEQGSRIAGFTSDSRTLVLAPREGDYRWHLIGSTNWTVEIDGTSLATGAWPSGRSDVLVLDLAGGRQAPFYMLGKPTCPVG